MGLCGSATATQTPEAKTRADADAAWPPADVCPLALVKTVCRDAVTGELPLPEPLFALVLDHLLPPRSARVDPWDFSRSGAVVTAAFDHACPASAATAYLGDHS
jgi:hypothetical protein